MSCAMKVTELLYWISASTEEIAMNTTISIRMESTCFLSSIFRTAPGTFASFFGPDPLNLLFVVILTSLGTWGLPQMVQKFYAIKNEESIKKGTIISTLFALVVAGGCYFLGGFGDEHHDQYPHGEHLLPVVHLPETDLLQEIDGQGGAGGHDQRRQR